MVSQSWGYETGSSRLETVSQGGHSATYSYDPNSIAKKIFIVADENGQTRYYDASSKCWKKIGLDLVENALAADAKGLEQFIAAQNGPSLREQILKDAFLSGDPSIGDWLLYQFFDKLNGAGTLDLASAYYHQDIFSQQSLSDEAATLYALWGGVQLGAASTELVDLGALAKGLFRPSPSVRFYDADYMVDLSGYAVAPKTRLNTYGDALRPSLGPAHLSHADEYAAIMRHVDELGVPVTTRRGTLAYEPSLTPGSPGRLILDPDASIGALRHEYRHVLDDFDLGHPGFRVMGDSDQFWRLEFRGYMEEINAARAIRDYDAGRAILQEMRQRRLDILGR